MEIPEGMFQGNLIESLIKTVEKVEELSKYVPQYQEEDDIERDRR